MTYDRQSTYLTWGGTIGSSGADQWQCGLHLALNPSLDGPGLPTPAELETLLNGPISEQHTQTQIGIAPYCFLGWAKAASLDSMGAYTTDPVSATRIPVAGGSTAAAQGAPQVALVVTLYSGSQLGEANYGRYYLPWCELQLGGDGKIPEAFTANVVGHAKTFVDGVNSWAASVLSAQARITIMSKKGAGTSKRPAVVRVGSVKDTQQRRRRQLTEIYATATIAP